MPKSKDKVSQVVLIGTRITPNTLGTLYQDEMKRGKQVITRLRIKLGDEIIGGVHFVNTTPRDYYFAMQRLSKKIGKPIQYVIVFQPVLPLETESYV